MRVKNKHKAVSFKKIWLYKIFGFKYNKNQWPNVKPMQTYRVFSNVIYVYLGQEYLIYSNRKEKRIFKITCSDRATLNS